MQLWFSFYLILSLFCPPYWLDCPWTGIILWKLAGTCGLRINWSSLLVLISNTSWIKKIIFIVFWLWNWTMFISFVKESSALASNSIYCWNIKKQFDEGLFWFGCTYYIETMKKGVWVWSWLFKYWPVVRDNLDQLNTTNFYLLDSESFLHDYFCFDIVWYPKRALKKLNQRWTDKRKCQVEGQDFSWLSTKFLTP